ncbi:hypothetical protein K435DRAFT_864864 [Dendrothele bispora CBS 962.96]|uniref:Uncharacterized protein n=1 Tax=Dendrothele bispora (strain CBS 962.96) TaxID=1314807 RepID=A0A4S8LKZ5_DENBC|nr:hypothetical protein K435DRAFT_864864 [Dendrothele bispora CBS 962.96]
MSGEQQPHSGTHRIHQNEQRVGSQVTPSPNSFKSNTVQGHVGPTGSQVALAPVAPLLTSRKDSLVVTPPRTSGIDNLTLLTLNTALDSDPLWLHTPISPIKNNLLRLPPLTLVNTAIRLRAPLIAGVQPPAVIDIILHHFELYKARYVRLMTCELQQLKIESLSDPSTPANRHSILHRVFHSLFGEEFVRVCVISTTGYFIVSHFCQDPVHCDLLHLATSTHKTNITLKALKEFTETHQVDQSLITGRRKVDYIESILGLLKTHACQLLHQNLLNLIRSYLCYDPAHKAFEQRFISPQDMSRYLASVILHEHYGSNLLSVFLTDPRCDKSSKRPADSDIVQLPKLHKKQKLGPQPDVMCCPQDSTEWADFLKNTDWLQLPSAQIIHLRMQQY